MLFIYTALALQCPLSLILGNITQVTTNDSAYSSYVFETLHKVLHHTVSSPSLFTDVEVMAEMFCC